MDPHHAHHCWPVGSRSWQRQQSSGGCRKTGSSPSTELLSGLPVRLFRQHLPQGLLTIVGEEGINLSGGQKQLLALARSLYKPSQILLLDETTAAMDRRTEWAICELLARLKKERIIVFVTHRLETAKRVADYTYIVDSGRIQASGTHEELMKTKNFYSEYWQ